MQVVLPTCGDRISPLLDVASAFLLMTPSGDGALNRRELLIAETDPITKAKRVAELGAKALICGAISWPPELLLTSVGMRVIPNTGGPIQQVIVTSFSGDLTEQALLLPGCPGRQHRPRHRHSRRWRHGW
ncbi:MAG: hypothetical protein JW751_07040 [Polyangiaceae bacterium]|nr:hypothetical protein [Polyangiaceae bacterium]